LTAVINHLFFVKLISSSTIFFNLITNQDEMKKLITVAVIALSFASCRKQHLEKKCGVVSEKRSENSSYSYIFYINGRSVPVDSATYQRTLVGALYCSESLANYSRP
jgi:hypothetical protein